MNIYKRLVIKLAQCPDGKVEHPFYEEGKGLHECVTSEYADELKEETGTEQETESEPEREDFGSLLSGMNLSDPEEKVNFEERVEEELKDYDSVFEFLESLEQKGIEAGPEALDAIEAVGRRTKKTVEKAIKPDDDIMSRPGFALNFIRKAIRDFKLSYVSIGGGEPFASIPIVVEDEPTSTDAQIAIDKWAQENGITNRWSVVDLWESPGGTLRTFVVEVIPAETT